MIPQDLLYTNKFTINIINQKEINDESQNFGRFINYESNQK